MAVLKEKIKSVVLDAHNHIDVSGYGGHLDRYVDPLDSHREYIESYLKSQWGWRTILGIVAFLIVYLLIIIDLEIDFSELLQDCNSKIPIKMVKAFFKTFCLINITTKSIPKHTHKRLFFNRHIYFCFPF